MSSLKIPMHSTSTMIKANLIAALVVVLAMVVLILPLEYDIDPTGLGAAFGLTEAPRWQPSNELQQRHQLAPQRQLRLAVNVEPHQPLYYRWHSDGPLQFSALGLAEPRPLVDASGLQMSGQLLLDAPQRVTLQFNNVSNVNVSLQLSLDGRFTPLQ
ncbi:hypothetical protein [uncultured Ferrimonas sp.]|uniref:hypothetical protein n=1 Tax=uncultured Ferrimonas sp. TaxID=432640 RepID=UPI0026356131|nr:hypothetical protein [uncultured Ferrimonas sp.]